MAVKKPLPATKLSTKKQSTVKHSPSLRSGLQLKQGSRVRNPEPSRRNVGTGSWVKSKSKISKSSVIRQTKPRLKKEINIKQDHPVKTQLTLPVYDYQGKELAPISVPEQIFNVNYSDILLATYVRVYLANQRQPSAVAKTRGEVSGSTRKIYRQKGTGRARHGSRYAPIFVGGGKAHGPRLHNFSLKLNKKQRQKALLYSLSKQYRQNNILICQDVSKQINKTKKAAQLLKNLSLMNKKVCLIYNPFIDEDINLYFRNIPSVILSPFNNLNTFQVLNANKLIFTNQGLMSFIKSKSK